MREENTIEYKRRDKKKNIQKRMEKKIRKEMHFEEKRKEEKKKFKIYLKTNNLKNSRPFVYQKNNKKQNLTPKVESPQNCPKPLKLASFNTR